MKSEMTNLFATLLYRSKLERQFSDAELAFFKQAPAEPVNAIGNYSSKNKNVLDATPMQAIRDILQVVT